MTQDIVLGIGGAGATSPELLKSYGISNLLLVGDHPDHGGDGIVRGLLKSTSLPSRVFGWPTQVDSKDPHEAIMKYGWDIWIEAITKLIPTESTTMERLHFEKAYKWLIKQTKKELSSLQPDDLQEIKRVVASIGCNLRDPDTQRLYCIAVSKFVPIGLSTLLEIVIGQDDSEEGFIARITEALSLIHISEPTRPY